MKPGQMLLAGSLMANMLLGWAYLEQRDAATEARGETQAMQQQRDGIRSAASACSVGVERLAEAGEKRAAAAAPVRQAAASRAAAHNRKADEILAAPPAVRGDACASAQARVDQWIKGRAAQ